MNKALLIVMFMVMPVCAYAQDIGQTMEELRQNIPLPQALSQENGTTVRDYYGQYYPVTRLEVASQAIKVEGPSDEDALLKYVSDKDPKLRYIAAHILMQRFKLHTVAFSESDALNVNSERYMRLETVLRLLCNGGNHPESEALTNDIQFIHSFDPGVEREGVQQTNGVYRKTYEFPRLNVRMVYHEDKSKRTYHFESIK